MTLKMSGFKLLTLLVRLANLQEQNGKLEVLPIRKGALRIQMRMKKGQLFIAQISSEWEKRGPKYKIAYFQGCKSSKELH